MTEPVAYIHNMKDGGTLLTTERRYTDNILVSTPLYSKSQLYPRVKMTKNQHKQFENYKKGKNSFYHFWQSLIVDDISLRKEFSERELMLVWLDEKTIEIVKEIIPWKEYLNQFPITKRFI